MARPSAEQWSAALHQLAQAHAAGQRTTAMVRLIADGLGGTERAVWSRLNALDHPDDTGGRTSFRLSETDRAAFADFRGNVAAVHRAREAALAGRTAVAGVPITEELLTGWAGTRSVTL